MGSDLDVAVARMAHLSLEMQLESMITHRNTQGETPCHIPPANLCALGLWLADNQQSPQSDTQNQLFSVHERFHRKAERLVAYLADAGTTLPPQRWVSEMEEIRLLSQEIIFLLTAIELAYLDAQRRHTWMAHPLKELYHRLFDDQQIVLSGEEAVLDVGYARLEHLRWLDALFKSFRNRGRHTWLDSEEQCALGCWIQQVGLSQWADLADMAPLDRAHQQFHTQAARTIQSLQRGRALQAEEAYVAVQAATRELLYLLTRLEMQASHSPSIRSTHAFSPPV